jgi:hypothetical protein
MLGQDSFAVDDPSICAGCENAIENESDYQKALSEWDSLSWDEQYDILDELEGDP